MQLHAKGLMGVLFWKTKQNNSERWLSDLFNNFCEKKNAVLNFSFFQRKVYTFSLQDMVQRIGCVYVIVW